MIATETAISNEFLKNIIDNGSLVFRVEDELAGDQPTDTIYWRIDGDPFKEWLIGDKYYDIQVDAEYLVEAIDESFDHLFGYEEVRGSEVTEVTVNEVRVREGHYEVDFILTDEQKEMLKKYVSSVIKG